MPTDDEQEFRGILDGVSAADVEDLLRDASDDLTTESATWSHCILCDDVVEGPDGSLCRYVRAWRETGVIPEGILWTRAWHAVEHETRGKHVPVSEKNRLAMQRAEELRAMLQQQQQP